MSVARAIQQMGFRKWYERELLHGHGHLVLLLFSALGLLGSLEVFSSHSAWMSQLAVLACLLASAVIGLHSLRRYLSKLGYAQYLADQAVCRACDAYARWDVEDSEDEHAAEVMRVRCRACGNGWQIKL
ncbi:MAG: hypothetical protein EOP82_14230 [Variovorax sp.]|nr:MAG: hypothetical protein EOP82_14230 [Variovorax sp.]